VAGLLSAASVASAMSIFFFAITHGRGPALVAYVGASAGLLGLWVLVTAGVFVDRGMLQLAQTSAANRGLLVFLVEATFLLTYLIARGSRRSRLHSVEDLDAAVRQIAQREALLDEARRELDQALQVGGPGRFTDH
jgi:hypothetical protein